LRKRNRFSGWDDRLIEGFLDLISKPFEQDDRKQGDRIKFVGYYELLKLLQEPRCPVCSIVDRSLRYYLKTVFIEQLTDGEFREPVRESLGYCLQHSELVRELSRKRLPRMGIAIVYEDILSQVQSALHDESVVRQRGDCPLCAIEADVESYGAQLIADYLGDDEFQKAFEESSGVCLPHLRSIGSRVDGEKKRFLFEAERKILDRLDGQLSEFIRKHDYRYTKEKINQQEAASWQRAVRFTVGE
jgi:hypothetical protein